MPGGYGLRDHSLGMRDPAPVLKTPKGLGPFLRIIHDEQLFFAYVMDGLGAMLLGTDSIKVPFHSARWLYPARCHAPGYLWQR